MKKFLIISGITLIAMSGCSHKDVSTEQVGGNASEATSEASPGSVPTGDGWHGSVVETMNSGGYTYILMDTDQEQKWIAGPETTITIGDKVAVRSGMPMKNFTSKTLDRTFEVIYFVGGIELDDGHTHD